MAAFLCRWWQGLFKVVEINHPLVLSLSKDGGRWFDKLTMSGGWGTLKRPCGGGLTGNGSGSSRSRPGVSASCRGGRLTVSNQIGIRLHILSFYAGGILRRNVIRPDAGGILRRCVIRPGAGSPLRGRVRHPDAGGILRGCAIRPGAGAISVLITFEQFLAPSLSPNPPKGSGHPEEARDERSRLETAWP